MDEMNLVPWRQVKAAYYRKKWAMIIIIFLLVLAIFVKMYPREKVVQSVAPQVISLHLSGLIEDGGKMQAMVKLPNHKGMIVRVGQKVGSVPSIITNISKKGVLFANGQLVAFHKKEWL